MLIRWPSGCRLVGRAVGAEAAGPPPPTCCISPSKKTLVVTFSGDGNAPRLGFGARRLDLPCGFALEIGPIASSPIWRFAQWALSLGSGSRAHSAATSPRTCRSACPGSCAPQAAEQSAAAAPVRAWPATCADRLVDQPCRFDRFGPVAIEDRQAREAGEVRRNIPARRLVIRRDRDAVPIVLDVNEQRQILRRGNG